MNLPILALFDHFGRIESVGLWVHSRASEDTIIFGRHKPHIFQFNFLSFFNMPELGNASASW